MSEASPEFTRRSLLVTAAAVSAASFVPGQLAAAGDGNAVRPFHISFPDEQLADLRRRIAATRWPEKETVADATQGVQLRTMRQLA